MAMPLFGAVAASTRYRIDDDNQVLLPPLAALRKGPQPVVELRVGGRERIEVMAGEPVDFSALVAVPPGAGDLVQLEWDFRGVGDFPVKEPADRRGRHLLLRKRHTFTEPGTYFTVLRATVQREGDAASPYARIQNIDRVRVVVSGPE
jgi:hypothetical protein